MAPKDGPKGYSKGKNGDSLSRHAQEEVSRTLVRILRYEKSNYSLEGPDGWVELDALLTNCRSQLKNFQRSEVLWVAQTSEGSKGPRFEVDPSSKWVRARYKHDGSEKGEKGRVKGGKSGKGKGSNGSNGANGKGYGSNGYESSGWENYQGVGSSNEANGSSTRPPWQDAYNGEDPWQKSDPWQKPQNGWRYERDEGKVENVENVEPKNANAARWANDTRHSTSWTSSEKEAPQPQSAARGVPPVPLGANGRSHETGHTHDPSNLRGAESFDISTPRSEEKTWSKYTDPANKRIWLWNSETDEHFYEDAAQHHGWNQYASDSGNWWHHDDTGRWFFDPKLAT